MKEPRFSTSLEFNGTHARCHHKKDQEWELQWFALNDQSTPCSTSTIPVAMFTWSNLNMPTRLVFSRLEFQV